MLKNIMSSPLLARTGRDRQRYEGSFRLVSGCIPYRLVKEDKDEDADIEKYRIEVLMISSPNRNDLVFPKGGWENDETVVEAACREALEEAGVRGTLREMPLGVWTFRSKSSCQDVLSMEGGCKGYMFALEVTEELDDWPEKDNRDRKWVGVKEAFELCRYEWMCNALEIFLRVMKEGGRNMKAEDVECTTPQKLASSGCQLLPPKTCVAATSSGNQQQHSISGGISTFWWQILLKRLPLR